MTTLLTYSVFFGALIYFGIKAMPIIIEAAGKLIDIALKAALAALSLLILLSLLAGQLS